MAGQIKLDSLDLQNQYKKSCLEPTTADQILLNPLILQKTLTYLSNADLFNTSIVCRRWNIFSREILRERKCLAKIASENPCHRLKQFIALLANSENVPYSGLSIETPWWDPSHNQYCCDEDILPQYIAETLSKINVLYLYVSISQYFKCVLVEFICNIIKRRSSDLQELHLHFVTFDQKFSQVLKIPGENLRLPNIRILGLTTYKNEEAENMRKETVTELIAAAPNIQKFNILIYPSFLEFILPRNLVPAVKYFCFRPNIHTLDSVMEFALRSPKLYSLKFGTVLDDENNNEIFSEPRVKQIGQILRLLLQSSQNSLHIFATDQLNLISIVSSFPKLNFGNAEKLKLKYGRTVDRTEGYSTLSKLDWANHFPHLKEVCISDSILDGRCRVRYIRNNFRHSADLYSCPTVTKLSLTSSELIRDPMQLLMFRRLFPNVKIFSFLESFYVNILMALWTAWPDLEEIIVQLSEPYARNFDSIFVGIGEEEVEYLLQQQELELGLLQIVPIKPCLQNLIKLEKLTVILSSHSKSKCNELKIKNRSGVSFSRLSGHCAFSRIPELHVEIERDLCSADCQFALRDLQPFANFRNRREECRSIV